MIIIFKCTVECKCLFKCPSVCLFIISIRLVHRSDLVVFGKDWVFSSLLTQEDADVPTNKEATLIVCLARWTNWHRSMIFKTKCFPAVTHLLSSLKVFRDDLCLYQHCSTNELLSPFILSSWWIGQVFVIPLCPWFGLAVVALARSSVCFLPATLKLSRILPVMKS